MPIIDGRFVPKRWAPLRGTLFDVITPDSPDDSAPATDEDWTWYTGLCLHGARVLLFVEQHVRRNYEGRIDYKFDAPTARALQAKRWFISTNFLDAEVSVTRVGNDLNRLAKEAGVVVYSTEPGQRHNWPMPGRPRFAFADALSLVEDALRGRWPETASKPAVQPAGR